MHLKDEEERTAGSDPRIRFSSLNFIRVNTSNFHLVYSLLNGLGWSSVCFGSIKTSKLSVSVIAKQPKQTVSVGFLFVSVQSKHRNSLFRYRSETTEINVLFRIVSKLVSAPVSVVSNRN